MPLDQMWSLFELWQLAGQVPDLFYTARLPIGWCVLKVIYWMQSAEDNREGIEKGGFYTSLIKKVIPQLAQMVTKP